MLQIVSDLHLEQGPVRFKNAGAHAVAILGDTCEWVRSHEKWKSAVLEASKEWQTVFVVNGNHEFYTRPLTFTKSEIEAQQHEFLSSCSNIHLLEHASVDWRGLKVAGCTLWSHVPSEHARHVKDFINDYNRIYVADRTTTMTVANGNAWHSASVKWLSETISAGQPTVVLTHHAPLKAGTSAPEYERDPDREMNSAFATDLSHLMKPNVPLWCFGHTHWSTDFTRGSTRIVSNSYGYRGETTCYKDQKVVEV